MDKKILLDYIDACEEIKEIEKDIEKLKKKKKTIVQGSVKGSMPEFPYTEQNFHIEGTAYTYPDDKKLREKELELGERKTEAEEVKMQVEAFMYDIPRRMRRIIRYKYFEEMTWEDAADRIGGKATGNGLRMKLKRFLEER